MQKNQTENILGLLRSSKKILEIQYTVNNQNIFYLSSRDGFGKLFILDKNGRSKKVSQNLNVGATVGYGGGDFDISENYFAVCEKGGDIYLIKPNQNQQSSPITINHLKTSSPKISPNENWVLYIYDQNEIGGIGITSTKDPGSDKQLVSGSDFYMHPTWHPGGKLIAWVEWDHPNMPWDASRIKIGNVSTEKLVIRETSIVDGQLDEPANQPLFSPDGKWLSYIKREGNWDNLMLYDLATRQKKVLIKGDGFHLHIPDWVQGQHSYQWSYNSTSIYFIKYHRGTSSYSKVDINTSEIKNIDISPFVWISQLTASKTSNETAFIACSQTGPGQIARISEEGTVSFDLNSIKQKMPISEGQEIVFPSKHKSSAYAWYYPPKSRLKNGEKPPCILNIHSGPTSVKHLGYSIETEIFTSQGYAIVYLNYHGSVTYGYDYQNALRKRWGEVEVQDAMHLVTELTSRGLVDPQKMAIMGSSAGGLSVLNVMIAHPGVFQAGICSYAVSDLVDDAKHTHKFEKYYHRFLTGDYPAEVERFIKRSPITHIEEIKDPLALFHGAKDKVVSPNQSKKIFNSLVKRGIPCILKIYDEEGHGFRKLENIENYYETVFDFLNSHL